MTKEIRTIEDNNFLEHQENISKFDQALKLASELNGYDTMQEVNKVWELTMKLLEIRFAL